MSNPQVGFSVNRPGPTEKMFKADVVLAIDHKGNVDCLKNRFGPVEESLPVLQMIELCSHFIADSVFHQLRGKGSKISLFQEGLAKEIHKAIENHMIDEGLHSGTSRW